MAQNIKSKLKARVLARRIECPDFVHWEKLKVYWSKLETKKRKNKCKMVRVR
jgi:hypothetical protein